MTCAGIASAAVIIDIGAGGAVAMTCGARAIGSTYSTSDAVRQEEVVVKMKNSDRCLARWRGRLKRDKGK